MWSGNYSLSWVGSRGEITGDLGKTSVSAHNRNPNPDEVLVMCLHLYLLLQCQLLLLAGFHPLQFALGQTQAAHCCHPLRKTHPLCVWGSNPPASPQSPPIDRSSPSDLKWTTYCTHTFAGFGLLVLSTCQLLFFRAQSLTGRVLRWVIVFLPV